MDCVRDFFPVQCADIVLGGLHDYTKDLLQIAVYGISHDIKIFKRVHRAANHFFLQTIVTLDEVRPLNRAVHFFLRQKFVYANLKDVRCDPSGEDVFAFFQVHHGNLLWVVIHGYSFSDMALTGSFQDTVPIFDVGYISLFASQADFDSYDPREVVPRSVGQFQNVERRRGTSAAWQKGLCGKNLVFRDVHVSNQQPAAQPPLFPSYLLSGGTLFNTALYMCYPQLNNLEA